MIQGRAETDAQKREVVEHLLRLWRRMPELRLGQLFANVLDGLAGGPDLRNVEDYALVANVGEFVQALAKSPEVPELGLRDVFFLGCWSRSHIGHYIHDRTGHSLMRGTMDEVLPFWLRQIDGTYCGSPSAEVREPQNRGRVVDVDGWTVLAFWDRTADERYGSNGAFIAKGTHDFEVMCEIGRRHFPSVWARITASEPMLKAVD